MTRTSVKVRDVLRHGMVLQTALDLLGRAGIRITPYVVLEESLDALPEGSVASTAPGLDLRPLTRADAVAIAAMPESDVGEEEARRWLDQGVVGIGAWSGEELVACTWARLDELGYAPCRRRLEPDEAYLFAARTSRRHRGEGLGPIVRTALYRHLADRGRTRLLSVSYSLNRPAMRFKQKLGARVQARYVNVRLWNRWTWNWRVS